MLIAPRDDSNNTGAKFDVAYIGNYTKDTIVNPAGTRYVDGGAVNYAAHACSRLGLKAAVFTHLAKEDERVIHSLNQAGVACFVGYTPHSTCVKLEYPTNNPDIRNLYVTSTAGSFTTGEIAVLDARAVVIGPTLRGEVGLDVIRALREKTLLVAVDVQGFVRVLRDQTLLYEPWDEMRAALACVDILKADMVEAEFLTGEPDIYAAAKTFAGMGPGEVVLTHQDGVLVYAQGQFYEAGFYPQKLDGRSGRGDTCIGTYVAMRLSKPPHEACIWAAAVTSLKMERLGPFNRNLSEVEEMIRRHYRNGSHLSKASKDTTT